MTNEQSPYSGRQLVDWADRQYRLRDADGDKIGDILEINPDSVIVETSGGFLGLSEARRYYIPRNQIVREDDDDWYLGIDKDELETMGWLTPPTGSTEGSQEWQQQAQSAGQVEAGATSTDRQGATRIVRYEEELQAQKVARQAGEVSVRKEVVEETQTIEVPVRREEVRIERHAVSGEAVAGDAAFTESEGTLRVPLMEEQIEVRKVARPVEEIELTKVATEETRQVSDTVRREEFDVEGDETRTSETPR